MRQRCAIYWPRVASKQQYIAYLRSLIGAHCAQTQQEVAQEYLE